MNEYKTIGERAHALIGRQFYQAGVGFGRVASVEIVWSNTARLTIRLRNGDLVTLPALYSI